MAIAELTSPPLLKMPTHLDLPWSDGKPVENSLQPRQRQLLTSSTYPHLQALHPAEDYYAGEDVGIYWRLADERLDGCRAPDWFYVPNVPRLIDGEMRRSYVMWNELEAPLLIVELASGNGREELDRTPGSGKFWIYERRIRAPYYAIHWLDSDRLEVYGLDRGTYRPVAVNERGHFPIPEMKAELGIWHGRYVEYTNHWVRIWDDRGNLLLTAEEREQRNRQQAEEERARAERANQRAELASQRAERLAEKLRQLGIEPNGS